MTTTPTIKLLVPPTDEMSHMRWEQLRADFIVSTEDTIAELNFLCAEFGYELVTLELYPAKSGS
jgi:hypothetical protein